MFDDATVKTLTMDVSGLNNVEIGIAVKNQLLKVLPVSIILIIDEYLKETCDKENCASVFYCPRAVCPHDKCLNRYCSINCFNNSFCRLMCDAKRCEQRMCGFCCCKMDYMNELLYFCDNCYFTKISRGDGYYDFEADIFFEDEFVDEDYGRIDDDEEY